MNLTVDVCIIDAPRQKEKINSPHPNVVNAFSKTHKFYQNVEGEETPAQKQAHANRIASRNIYIATNANTLHKVLKGGQFISPFKGKQRATGTKHSGRQARVDFEKAYFGGHPVYGYLSETPQGTSTKHFQWGKGRKEVGVDKLQRYGPVRVQLHSFIRPHTTFTSGDSQVTNQMGVSNAMKKVEPNIVHSLPSPVNAPHWSSISPYGNTFAGASKKEFQLPNYKRQAYDEAQIHRAVNKNDIHSVHFMNHYPSPDVVRLLKQHAIPWKAHKFRKEG